MFRDSVRRSGKALFGGAHRIGLRAGLVILPNHYYTPFADQHTLRKTKQQWAHRSSMRGIRWSIEEQANYLEKHVGPFTPEFSGNAAYERATAGALGPGYGPIEAQALHGMIRSLKPSRIIEVGSGISTYCMLHAVAKNKEDGHHCDLTCIEPYPSNFIKNEKHISLVESAAEKVNPELFDDLSEGDLLFIDSTHAVRPCGDVEFLYLDVIPRLSPGVVVHIHDTYFPYRYQRNLTRALFQWTETILLQALLTDNARLSVLMSLSFLHYDAQDKMRRVFPDYTPQPAIDGLIDEGAVGHFPSAIYLQTN